MSKEGGPVATLFGVGSRRYEPAMTKSALFGFSAKSYVR